MNKNKNEGILFFIQYLKYQIFKAHKFLYQNRFYLSITFIYNATNIWSFF
jgi:hypothetical protein